MQPELLKASIRQSPGSRYIIDPCMAVRAVYQNRVTTSQNALLLHMLLDFEKYDEAFYRGVIWQRRKVVALFHCAYTDDHSKRFSVMLYSSIRRFSEVATLKNATLKRQVVKSSWYVALPPESSLYIVLHL
jgi:hypothetical protein